MGYTVQLLRGDVAISRQHQDEALQAVKEVDRTGDDLKSGWSRNSEGEQVAHWAFVDADIQAIDNLPELLRAFRFDPLVYPATGDIEGVDFIDHARSRGDEFHIWSALAPFVDAGGLMDWYGEDEAVERWVFDGAKLAVVPGTLRFGKGRSFLRKPSQAD